jgi:FkbM family methyltransferase
MTLTDRIVNLKHTLELFYGFRLFNKIRTWQAFLSCYCGIREHEPVEIRLVNGLRFVVRPWRQDQRTIHEIIIRDDYRLATVKSVRGTIVDIGANIGFFSASAARQFPGTGIIACEPLPENISVLSETITRNHLEADITIVKKALAGKAGPIEFYESTQSSGEGSLLMHAGSISRTVEALTLADLFREYRIERCGLLKMDVEGAEYQILYNTDSATLRLIDRIHLEYHTVKGDPAADRRALQAFLVSNGFLVTAKHLLNGVSGYLYAQRSL